MAYSFEDLPRAPVYRDQPSSGGEKRDFSVHGAHLRSPELRVNRHTMSIGVQVFQLRNIARVQTLEVKPRVVRNIIVSILILIGSILVSSIVILFSGLLSLVTAERSYVGSILALVINVAAIAYIIWLLTRRSVFMLVIETNGSPMAVLSSKYASDLDELFHIIANALENPPEATIVKPITNLVIGDQINQRGSGLNIGKMLQHA